MSTTDETLVRVVSMNDWRVAPSHPSSTQMRDSSARGDPRRMRCADGGRLDLSHNSDSAAPREAGSARTLMGVAFICFWEEARDGRARGAGACACFGEEGRDGCARTRGADAGLGGAPQGARPRRRLARSPFY